MFSQRAALFLLCAVPVADGFAGKCSTARHRAPPLSLSVAESLLLKPYEGNSEGIQLASAAFDSLFSFKPLLKVASAGARKMIVERADSLGVGWQGRVDEMRRDMDVLQGRFDNLLNKEVETPEYYYAPFHAYEKGNLCWEASFEVEPSAISVHSHIYTPKGEFERGGDDKLRGNFHDCMTEMLQGWRPRDIVDVGSSTGLSTLKLASTFPEARVTGLDLSPHMLAVAQHKLAAREDRSLAGRIEYMHAAGEATGLPDASADLVSICLVSHELPASAARAVFREAFRLLRPGGALSFMDMNPAGAAFRALANNPIAFAAYKSTEPYFLEYVNLDLAAELREAGFKGVDARANSPRHRTVVASVDK